MRRLARHPVGLCMRRTTKMLLSMCFLHCIGSHGISTVAGKTWIQGRAEFVWRRSAGAPKTMHRSRPLQTQTGKFDSKAREPPF